MLIATAMSLLLKAPAKRRVVVLAGASNEGEVMQRADILICDIFPRAEIDPMSKKPRSTDVPRFWMLELCKARDFLDKAERLLDESEATNRTDGFGVRYTRSYLQVG
ncbi:protein of unknown function [Bradyrhizobium sp. ORS 285]|nr:hypothetical protein BRAO285_2630008 [Bradyrhizobium sp. ORS 285]SMX62160.1 protein of unknown function [Bradyrhizobium sp. ORS 285]